MLSIDEALELIVSRARPLPATHVETANSLGLTLAEDVCADVDSPPHDKALVDGFAVRIADVLRSTGAAGQDQEAAPSETVPSLEIIERVIAGAVPTRPLTSGTTTQVMTGAPIPVGAEAMVMVEDTETQGDRMYYHGNAVAEGQGVMRRAAVFAERDVVLQKGTRIRPIEVGLLCEVGRGQVSCVRRPRVAVLPTGEELVDATQQPGPGQIRNSNGPMLRALVTAAQGEATLLDVAPDRQEDLREQILQGLQADLLILSGGVSAGVRDLVPPTLDALGVECVFHKVAIKPGKPIWFGTYQDGDRRTLVFGLPGNPISSLACFQLFVKTALRCLAHRPTAVPWQPVRLATDFPTQGNRPTFWPAKWYLESGRRMAKPLPWRGSADMLTVSQADCFVFFPHSPQHYRAGEKLEALVLD